VGNSLGAWVAMLIAQRNPERVSLAVCVDGGAIRGSNLHARVLPRNRHEARESVEQTRDRRSPHVPDFVLDDIVRQAHQGSLARFAATEATMNHYLLDEAQLREIAVPVRLIWGRSDRWSPGLCGPHARSTPIGGAGCARRVRPCPTARMPAAFVAALRNALELEKK